MRVLIPSIFRNAEKNIPHYFEQLSKAVNYCKDVEFYFSAYENDSSDKTLELLYSQKWESIFKDRFSIVSETIGTKFYGSSTDSDRVKNLAEARNKATFAKNFYQNVDFILMIDDDITYEEDTIFRLLNFKSKHNLKNVDIVTPACIQSTTYPQFICRDIWAVRRDENEEWGSFFDNAHITPYDRYWSVGNAMQLFKAKPFQEGLKWSAWNKRLNKWDCDLAVICEDFRSLGYTDIFIDHNLIVIHWKLGINQ